jgi:hypothetical protein
MSGNVGHAEENEECKCGARFGGGEMVSFFFRLGETQRVIMTCEICDPKHFGGIKLDAELASAVFDEVDDDLPETIDMPLLELRERQLAACTRVMLSVAVKLRKLDADYGKYQEDSRQFIKLAERLEAVRAGYKDPNETENG